MLNVYNRYVDRTGARDHPEAVWRLLRRGFSQQPVEVVGYFEPCAEVRMLFVLFSALHSLQSFLILNYGLYSAVDDGSGAEVLRRNM